MKGEVMDAPIKEPFNIETFADLVECFRKYGITDRGRIELVKIRKDCFGKQIEDALGIVDIKLDRQGGIAKIVIE
jgi:hypothetical protein